MRLRILSVVAAAFAMTAIPAAKADIIFDNTTSGNQGITTTSLPQLGDQVTAAGLARTVTELDLGFTSQGVAGTANFQAFLYANDGSGGSPGTLLWQSAVMTNASINSTNALIAFSVPSVLVPNSFTFTASITNASTVVGFVPASGATTGAYTKTWVGSPGSWSTLSSNFEIEGRVIGTSAVPEPMSLALVGIGAISALGFRRHQRKLAA